jgi:hypothetical protein
VKRFDRLIANGREGRIKLPLSKASYDWWRTRWAEQQRHIYWLIEHHPAIDLPDGWNGLPFALHSDIAERWRDAARRYPDDDDVAWNAAKACSSSEPTAAMELFERAKRSAPGRAREILKLCSLQVGLWTLQGEQARDQALGQCGVSNGFEAFELAESDDGRFMMVWSMRECAKFTGNKGLLGLLRAADREGNLRRDHGADPRDAKHHACTGRGLIARPRRGQRCRRLVPPGVGDRRARASLVNRVGGGSESRTRMSARGWRNLRDSCRPTQRDAGPRGEPGASLDIRF